MENEKIHPQNRPTIAGKPIEGVRSWGFSHGWHELKTDPEAFRAVRAGVKSFEIRFDDRGYKVGDILQLQETRYTGEEMKAGKPLEYTGREEIRKVAHILRGPVYGLMEGWVILSFEISQGTEWSKEKK